MTTVFVDASYYLALTNGDDEHHERAVALERTYRGKLVTTEYVLVEVLDALTSGKLREVGVEVYHAVLEDANTTLIPASSSLLAQGVALFQSRPDKQWGITDCISFIVMQDHDITEALTADRHFDQAGFKALLRQL